MIKSQLTRLINLFAFRPGTVIAFFGVLLAVLIAYSPKAMAVHWALLVCLLPFCAYDFARDRTFIVPDVRQYWLPVLCLFWMAVSALHGDEQNAVHAWSVFVSIALYVILTIVAVHIFSRLPEAERSRAQTGFLWGIFLALILFAVELYFNNPFYKKFHWRIYDKDVPEYVLNRGYVALYVLIWPAALMLWQKRWQVFSVLIVLACAAFAPFTHMQAAQVAFAAAAGIWLLALISPRVARAVCLGAFVALVFFTYPATLQFYKSGMLQLEELPSSARHRVEIWHFAGERILQKPIFGWGLDASRIMPDEGEVSQFLGAGKSVIPLHPHNIVLQIWMELGAVGLALFAMLGVWILDRIRHQSARAQSFMLPSFAAALSFACLSHGIWQMWLFVIFISAFAWFALARPSQDS